MVTKKEAARAAEAELQPSVSEDEGTVNVRALQFPSVAGEPAIETGKRSADTSEDTSDFVKTFVVAGPDEVGADHPCHEHNKVRVLEEAAQRGLHVKGDPVLVETTVVDRDRRGVVSTACTYRARVVPSAVDSEAHTTRMPSSDVRVTGRHASAQ